MFLRKSLILVFCTILLTTPLFIKGGETKKESAIRKVGHSSRIHPRSDELGYGNGKADIYWVDAKIMDTLRKK